MSIPVMIMQISCQSGKLVDYASICSSTFCNPEFQGFIEPSSENLVKNPSSNSPCRTPDCIQILSQEARTSAYDFSAECSSFSVDSLHSGNVMQTPSSDSSSERHGRLHWPNKALQPEHCLESELDHITGVLQHENSDFDYVSKSQIQISWRDGPVSGSYDLDDIGCCRLLSDEEDDADGQDQRLTPNFYADLESKHFLGGGLKSPKLMEQKTRINENGKEVNWCAESISTDGDGLSASGDSDWSIYYKHQTLGDIC